MVSIHRSQTLTKAISLSLIIIFPIFQLYYLLDKFLGTAIIFYISVNFY